MPWGLPKHFFQHKLSITPSDILIKHEGDSLLLDTSSDSFLFPMGQSKNSFAWLHTFPGSDPAPGQQS